MRIDGGERARFKRAEHELSLPFMEKEASGSAASTRPLRTTSSRLMRSMPRARLARRMRASGRRRRGCSRLVLSERPGRLAGDDRFHWKQQRAGRSASSVRTAQLHGRQQRRRGCWYAAKAAAVGATVRRARRRWGHHAEAGRLLQRAVSAAARHSMIRRSLSATWTASRTSGSSRLPPRISVAWRKRWRNVLRCM
jgi:hypothetical protein